MQEAVRKEYLKAMGVEVWVRRSMDVGTTEPQTLPASEPISAAIAEEDATHSREIFRQNATEFTRWLSAQCLMPLRVGDVSVTTIGYSDAQLLVLSESTVIDKVTHQPFSGSAAFLLQAMLRAIGESFETVLQGELDTPRSDAKTLVSLLQKHPIKAVLLLVDLPVSEQAKSLLHFRKQTYIHDDVGTRIFVSYHPDYLIAHPETKALAWEDLKQVHDYLADE